QRAPAQQPLAASATWGVLGYQGHVPAAVCSSPERPKLSLDATHERLAAAGSNLPLAVNAAESKRFRATPVAPAVAGNGAYAPRLDGGLEAPAPALAGRQTLEPSGSRRSAVVSAARWPIEPLDQVNSAPTVETPRMETRLSAQPRSNETLQL